MPTDASATVRALVAEIPVERLRELFIQFVCGGLVPSPAVAAAPTGDAAARKRERARQWIARKRRAARAAKAAAASLMRFASRPVIRMS
jgi:hypothetical protein